MYLDMTYDRLIELLSDHQQINFEQNIVQKSSKT